MKKVAKIIFVIAILAMPRMAFAVDPGPDSASCNITVTVTQIIEWSAASYADIALANITAQADQPTGTRDFTLYTNCNVSLTSDTTNTAQLTNTTAPSTDTLTTEYSLSYDGDGSAATGGAAVAWTNYDTFIGGGSSVTHVDGDGAVVATLSVRASNPAGEVADAGDYTATQTLTASWVSD